MSLMIAVQCDGCGRVAHADRGSPLRMAWKRNRPLLRSQLTLLGWDCGEGGTVNAPDRCPACVEKYGPVVEVAIAPSSNGG